MNSLNLRTPLGSLVPDQYGHFHFEDFRCVDAVFVCVIEAGYLLVFKLALGMSTRHFETVHAINDVD